MSGPVLQPSPFRCVVLGVLWIPPLFFAFSAVAAMFPISYQTLVNVKGIGTLLGALAVVSVPVAGVLTVMWWTYLPKALRAVAVLIAALSIVAVLFWVLAYANPFFSNA